MSIEKCTFTHCEKSATFMRQFMTGGTLKQHLCTKHAEFLAGNINTAWLFFRIAADEGQMEAIVAGEKLHVEKHGRSAEYRTNTILQDEDVCTVDVRSKAENKHSFDVGHPIC